MAPYQTLVGQFGCGWGGEVVEYLDGRIGMFVMVDVIDVMRYMISLKLGQGVEGRSSVSPLALLIGARLFLCASEEETR